MSSGCVSVRNKNPSRHRSSFVHNTVHKVRSNLNEVWLIDPLLSGAFHQKESLGSAIWALTIQEIHIKEDFEVE